MDEPLLQISDLRVQFRTAAGPVRAVDGISLAVKAGETLGLVGESGCGKTVTGLSILRLIDPPGEIVQGSIRLARRELLSLSEKELRPLRGTLAAMVFQEPMTSLNPVFTIGEQLIETLLVHRHCSRQVARQEALEALRRVDIPAPESRLKAYPHELSGGMKQRVMIAMALLCQPALLIADEPTTALDATVQAQLLELLQRLQQETAMAMLLITHDLGVVAECAHQVAVMYAGQVVEQAPVHALFARPTHPYTQGLFRSLPGLAPRGTPLQPIPGMVPRPQDLPTGCRFRNRCPVAQPVCAQPPPDVPISDEHRVRCHLAQPAARP